MLRGVEPVPRDPARYEHLKREEMLEDLRAAIKAEYDAAERLRQL